MTRSLVGMLSFLSASTLLACPAVQVQNDTPSFRKLMESTWSNMSPPAQPTVPDGISPFNDLPGNVLSEIASFLSTKNISIFTATMLLFDDMQEEVEITKAAIMHEDRNATQNGYADFEFAEAEGWHAEDLTKLIFNKNVDPQKLFKWASHKNHSTISIMVAHATDLQIDLTADNNHVMIWATYHGWAEVVKRLLEWKGTGPLEGKRVDPKAGHNNYAFQMASKKGHTENVKLLLEWKGTGLLEGATRVDATTANNVALKHACEKGHTEIVKLILAWVGKGPQLEGMRVNATSGDNWTVINSTTYPPVTDSNHPLQIASKEGQTEIVKLLLEWEGTGDLAGVRVDPTKRNREVGNHNTIEIASKEGHTEIVKLLLAWEGTGDLAGVRVDSVENVNLAIELAKENGKDEIVEILLEWMSG